MPFEASKHCTALPVPSSHNPLIPLVASCDKSSEMTDSSLSLDCESQEGKKDIVLYVPSIEHCPAQCLGHIFISTGETQIAGKGFNPPCPSLLWDWPSSVEAWDDVIGRWVLKDIGHEYGSTRLFKESVGVHITLRDCRFRPPSAHMVPDLVGLLTYACLWFSGDQCQWQVTQCHPFPHPEKLLR